MLASHDYLGQAGRRFAQGFCQRCSSACEHEGFENDDEVVIILITLLSFFLSFFLSFIHIESRGRCSRQLCKKSLGDLAIGSREMPPFSAA
jgi:hypothetical protein